MAASRSKNNTSLTKAKVAVKRLKGFTLLEVLIALFIFTILSTILVGALRTVIDAHAGTEKNAERLRTLQFALLVISRDIEQAINRPIFNASGKEEPAFSGTPKSFVFTHTGFANLNNTKTRSTLERTGYTWNEGALWRLTWDVLDQAPQSRAHLRKLLDDISLVQFQYLDHDGHFLNDWPKEGDTNQALPRAISVQFTFSHWGKISQLYVIPVHISKNSQTPQSTLTS
jgi:general secretion pathway protein J